MVNQEIAHPQTWQGHEKGKGRLGHISSHFREILIPIARPRKNLYGLLYTVGHMKGEVFFFFVYFLSKDIEQPLESTLNKHGKIAKGYHDVFTSFSRGWTYKISPSSLLWPPCITAMSLQLATFLITYTVLNFTCSLHWQVTYLLKTTRLKGNSVVMIVLK